MEYSEKLWSVPCFSHFSPQRKTVVCPLFLSISLNGLYKAGVIHRRGPWKSRAAVELATLEWVSWFNHQRLMRPLGYISPAEAEANYCRQLASQAAIAA